MSFDRLAPHYRWMEAILAGGKLHRCRTAFLSRVGDAREALLLGEGNGRFLTEFLRLNSNARITCLDASLAMLRAAARRVIHAGLDPSRAEFVHADVLRWNPSGLGFDLVVTNFFLDCFPANQLARVIAHVGRATPAGSTWLLADFCEPQPRLLRCRARLILRMMYAFFRVATSLSARTLTPPDDLLSANGFCLVERRVTEWGLLHSDRWVRASASVHP